MRILAETSKLEKDIQDYRSITEKISDIYFKPKSFEENGKLYETLGVKYVKKAVMNTAGKMLEVIGMNNVPNYFLKGRDIESLKITKFGTKINESIHLYSLAWSAHETVKAIADQNYTNAILGGLSILANAELIFLQRYNRARVDKTIKRVSNKHKDSSPKNLINKSTLPQP